MHTQHLVSTSCYIYLCIYLLKGCVDDIDKTDEKQLKGGNQESGLYAQQLSVASSRYDIWYQAIFFNNILIVRICPKNTSHWFSVVTGAGPGVANVSSSAPTLSPPPVTLLSELTARVSHCRWETQGQPGILYYGINLDLVHY